MGKNVLPTKQTEWKGLDRISQIVHDMGCIWREMTKDDYGLDGEIEVVTPKSEGKGFETTGGIVKVQAKAGESYVVQDSHKSFASPVEKGDLDYWHKCNFPVLYIVFHPTDDRLYYKEVKQYIQQTPDVFARPYRIRFDKAKDVFGPASKNAVCAHASVSPPRVAYGLNERLFSNLLPVLRLPQRLYWAKTRKRSWQAIKDEVDGSVPPGCIVDGRIYALTDPTHTKSVLRQWCIGDADTIPSQDWVQNEERVNDFIFLLNQLLGKHMARCGIRYNPDFGRNYFPRENDTDLEFKRPWTSVRTGVQDERTVAKWYEYGLDKFWRHLAAETAFVHFGDWWFLRLIPRYFFTTDGETPWDSDQVGPYTTSIKAAEHNSQVLNHVLFWADVLSLRKPEIVVQLHGTKLMRIRKMPFFGVAPFAIPDDPATYQETVPPAQPGLFDTEGEDDDDENDAY